MDGGGWGGGGAGGNCEEVMDESDYWKETQFHGSNWFQGILTGHCGHCGFFFKSVTYRHKKVIQSSGLNQSFVRKLLEENNLSPKECI